jgi:hypothetical protein
MRRRGRGQDGGMRAWHSVGFWTQCGRSIDGLDI